MKVYKLEGWRDCFVIRENLPGPPIIPGWSDKLAKWRKSNKFIREFNLSSASKGLGEEWNIHQLAKASQIQGYDLYS